MKAFSSGSYGSCFCVVVAAGGPVVAAGNGDRRGRSAAGDGHQNGGRGQPRPWNRGLVLGNRDHRESHLLLTFLSAERLLGSRRGARRRNTPRRGPRARPRGHAPAALALATGPHHHQARERTIGRLARGPAAAGDSDGNHGAAARGLTPARFQALQPGEGKAGSATSDTQAARSALYARSSASYGESDGSDLRSSSAARLIVASSPTSGV